MSNPSVNKRQKEKNRQDKAREKAAKRQERQKSKNDRPTTDASGAEIDPDIAGIVPGPQPPAEDY
jgi:hypothetical protein